MHGSPSHTIFYLECRPEEFHIKVTCNDSISNVCGRIRWKYVAISLLVALSKNTFSKDHSIQTKRRAPQYLLCYTFLVFTFIKQGTLGRLCRIYITPHNSTSYHNLKFFRQIRLIYARDSKNLKNPENLQSGKNPDPEFRKKNFANFLIHSIANYFY